jgi:hypothetical protein
MLNTKIYKPLEEDFIIEKYGSKSPNNSSNTFSKYSELAQWCNSNNAMIVDRGDYYEAVPVPEPTEEELARFIRGNRDAKLSETDYLVVPDYPISEENLTEVKAYRQALRDITEQTGFPKDVSWPDVPKFLCKSSDGRLGLAKVGI